MPSATAFPKSSLQTFLLPSPTQSSTCPRRDHQLPPLAFQQQTHPASEAAAAAAKSGLRTPPTDLDAMATTYQVPTLASYDNHASLPPLHPNSYYSTATTVPLPDRSRPTAPMRSSLVPQPNTQPLQLPHPSQVCTQVQQYPPQAPVHPNASSKQHSARPSSPAPGYGSMGEEQKRQATLKRDADMVLHSLVMPSCINPRGGNLADFAAEMATLFWFESTKNLEALERVHTSTPGSTIWRPSRNALADPGFKKWVHMVLSTTQVTQNVILLALLFIWRLKFASSQCYGRPGSEYRLLTVALMLGNKFLDDNTYTNKTWADVSAINVAEIHVMEVEFLNNLRYSLLASKEQWEEWLVKLARFSECMERARQLPISPVHRQPSHREFSSPPLPLSSPVGVQQAPQSASAHPFALSPMTNRQPADVMHTSSHYYPNSAVSPLAAKPDLHSARPPKRPYPDYGQPDADEAPPKRQHLAGHSAPSQPPSHLHSASGIPRPVHMVQHQSSHVQYGRPTPPNSGGSAASTSSARPPSSRLAVPNLTINTQTAMQGLSQTTSNSFSAASYAPQAPSALSLSLPPLGPNVRAMSTVFPPMTSSSIPSSAVPVVTPTTGFPPTTHFNTPTRRLSPQNALTPMSFATSSPMADSFPQHCLTPHGHMGTASGVHTPLSQSPSIYLQHRHSPYKPVRHVNALLYPPPSTSLQQYHLGNSLPASQMQYQPLGRRNEFRTGVVPEYALATSYYGANGGQQHHVSAPAPAQGGPHFPHHPMSAKQNMPDGLPRLIPSMYPN